MKKSILILAFQFPPIAISSGVQRALATVRYLREDGWRPIVLTANTRAYSRTTEGQLADIPSDVPVHRAFGLDSTRHLGVRGRYLGLTALPDRWISWWPAAAIAGSRLIRKYKPVAIWSTFPIGTTNLVAMRLARIHNLPWIADFRDPMSMDGYPDDRLQFRCARWIEQKTIQRAKRVVFTTHRAKQIYDERYPGLSKKSVVINNGFEEANFPQPIATGMKARSRNLKIVHSGLLQPEGRDVGVFFEALKYLKDAGEFDSIQLTIVLRACSFEKEHAELARQLGIADLVEIAGYLPYNDAIKEMVSADGLLVVQGAIYNHAVPAKLYEYLYARTPIFGLLDKDGETERVLQSVGIMSTAQIDDFEDIVAKFHHYISDIRNSTFKLPEPSSIMQYSRRNQVAKLSTILKAETEY